MKTELKITLKDEEKKVLSDTYILYEPFTMCEDDPTIQECLKKLLSEFKSVPEDIIIKATMVLQ